MAISSAYKRYLKSDKWFDLRDKALERADYECQICGRHSCTLQVHHLNYDNIFNEEPEDLLVACKTCHKHLDKIRKLKVSLKSNPAQYRMAENLLENKSFPFKINSKKELRKVRKNLEKIDQNSDLCEEIFELSEGELK